MPNKGKGSLAATEKKALALKESLGNIRVLCVGVSDYPPKSGFKPLKQCRNDAFHVQSAFLEVPQLNADKDHVILMSSDASDRIPSRGLILDQLHELSSSCQADERLMFYFSGHGHRIDGIDDHFLVPQDAYSENKPDALISMKEVVGILTQSAAKQKIIVLDACLSGPTLLGKKLHAASYSDKSFAKYLAAAKGVAVLSSSAASESSYTKSDNPKLSLFTLYFAKALRGEPGALDTKVLTLPSLFDYVSTEVKRKNSDYRIQQTPSLETTSNATLILADFRKPLVSHASQSLKDHFVEALVLRETFSERTKAILTEWKDRSKPVDQLEWAANTDGAMEAYLKDDFAEWRSSLRRQFSFASTDIASSGSELTFPGGALTYRYKAETKDSGRVLRKLTLDIDWFGDGARLAFLLDILQFQPSKTEFKLATTIAPLEQIAGLEANGWTIESESDDVVVARKDEVALTIKNKSLAFEGVDIREVLAESNKIGTSRRLLMETVLAIAPEK
jgi:hypothetical protein